MSATAFDSSSFLLGQGLGVVANSPCAAQAHRTASSIPHHRMQKNSTSTSRNKWTKPRSTVSLFRMQHAVAKVQGDECACPKRRGRGGQKRVLQVFCAAHDGFSSCVCLSQHKLDHTKKDLGFRIASFSERPPDSCSSERCDLRAELGCAPSWWFRLVFVWAMLCIQCREGL